MIISERSFALIFVFLFGVPLSTSQKPGRTPSQKKSPQRQSLLSFFFFAKKQEKGKTHTKTKFFSSFDSALSAPARIVSKQTHTHTHTHTHTNEKKKEIKRREKSAATTTTTTTKTTRKYVWIGVSEKVTN